MRAPRPPVRFLILVIGLWVTARAAVLTWPYPSATVVEAPGTPGCPSCQRRLASLAPAAAGIVRGERHELQPALGRRVGVERAIRRSDPPRRTLALVQSAATVDSRLPGNDGMTEVVVRATPPADLAAPSPRFVAAAPAASSSRWSGSAWLFVRGSGGDSLAQGGQLGGSQAGARIAWRVDDAGKFALAARAYMPVDHPRGSEAAVGVDWHPLPAMPFRLSAERRIAIGRDGRDAWSAYAAGGFFRGLPGDVELDGYAQAGVVGAKRRDLFADGAMRVARRVAVGRSALLVGAGAWGAAQPGAERLDVGPRVAVRVPAGAATLSASVDARLRVAGDARPGSGAALTLSADF
jgi:hypothetical protein